MGSSFVNSPYKPWTPADAVLRDCSQGICSFYCPQWCSVIYPPPPLPSLTAIGVAATTGDEDDDSSSSFRLSPLIVALFGIVASAFVLITYYTIISRFCTRRTRIHQNDTNQWVNDNDESAIQAPNTGGGGGGGLDDAVIKSITVCKYKKGDGLVEGTDCSVCLSEFQDCENLRLLPKCNHAFHLHCIDTWLRSHSSCPLCRSNIVISNTFSSSSSGNLPNQSENSQFQEASRTHSVNVSALEHQHRNDTVIVIQGSEQEIQVGFAGNLEERSGIASNQRRFLLVADILRSREDDEDEDEEGEIGSSKQNRRREDKRKVRSE